MQIKYVSPQFKALDYNCPHCGVYARHRWEAVNIKPDLYLSLCSACQKELIWHNQVVIYPPNTSLPPPHVMLPKAIYPYYHLARSLSLHSSAAACAYLRHTIHLLFIHIGGKGFSHDDDVDFFIAHQLGTRQFWEAFRRAYIFGYSQREGLFINEDDNEVMMDLLFYLTNSLVEETIANPLTLIAFYAKLDAKEPKEPIIDEQFYERP